MKYYIVALLFFLPFLTIFFRKIGHQFSMVLFNYLRKSLASFGLSFLSLDLLNLTFIPLMGLGIIFFIAAEVKRLRIKYLLFDDGAVKKVGFFTTSIKNVSYTKADSVHINRKITDKIFGTGDLTIKTIGNTEPLVLEGLANPKKWATFITKKAGIERG